MKHYFIDFDETLVDTSQLFVYRTTREGRDYITNHPEDVPTELISEDFKSIIIELNKGQKVSIITNSPQDYVQALLAKHAFPNNIPIHANLHKPCSLGLNQVIHCQRLNPNDALVIGDSTNDILAAHGCGISSVAVAWGKTSTPDQLRQSEPTSIISAHSELAEVINSFEQGRINYTPRTQPDNYMFCDVTLCNLNEDPINEYLHLFPYYPVGHPNFKLSNSGAILDFKESKSFTLSDIINDRKASFFYGGRIIDKTTYKYQLNYFLERLRTKISSLNLQGMTLIIAAPNSAPEYCYKSDINYITAWNLQHQLFQGSPAIEFRILFRIYPMPPSHIYGNRNLSEHLQTIGISNNINIEVYNNILIFDDVTTTQTQIKSIAYILRSFYNYRGNIISICLGKTEC